MEAESVTSSSNSKRNSTEEKKENCNNLDKRTSRGGTAKVLVEHEIHMFQKTFTKEQLDNLSLPEMEVNIDFEVSFNTGLFAGKANKFSFKLSEADDKPTYIDMIILGSYSEKIELTKIRFSWLPLEMAEDKLCPGKTGELSGFHKELGENETIKIKNKMEIRRKYFKHYSVLRLYFVIYACEESILPYLTGFSKPGYDFTKGYFQQTTLSDVTIKVNDDIFPAHRIILSETSPVFQRMFEAEMSENSTRTVEIKDFEPNIVKEFLECVYTGSCATLNSKVTKNTTVNNIMALFELSDKYDVKDLRSICELKLKKLINVGNVVKIHTIAFLHNAEFLVVDTRRFFEKHRMEVIPNTEALLDIMKEYNPSAIHDLLIIRKT